MVDRGDDFLAVEVKSGATLHSSFFESLKLFSALAREAVPPLRDGVQALLVYGGDRRQQRSAGEVLPWKEIQSFPWLPGHPH